MFKNRVLQKIKGPKWKEGRNRRLEKMCTEERHGLNSSPHLIPMIKLMQMSWVGHRAFTQETGYTEV